MASFILTSLHSSLNVFKITIKVPIKSNPFIAIKAILDIYLSVPGGFSLLPLRLIKEEGVYQQLNLLRVGLKYNLNAGVSRDCQPHSVTYKSIVITKTYLNSINRFEGVNGPLACGFGEARNAVRGRPQVVSGRNEKKSLQSGCGQRASA